MAKKTILVYSDLYDWYVSELVKEVLAAGNSGANVRFLCDGGQLDASWAFLQNVSELKGENEFTNDGKANSMAAFAFCYNKGKNTATDVATFGFHRAAFWSEENLSDEDKRFLEGRNKKLRIALESKVDVAKFTERCNVTMDELFAMDCRREVVLSADDALYCGLIDEVKQLTPSYKQDIEAKFNIISAKFSQNKIAAQSPPTPITPTTMTIDELKSKHRETYNAIFALGKKKGVAIERDRVSALITHIDSDKVKVVEAIKKGDAINETMRSELMQAQITALTIGKIEGGNAPGGTTPGTPLQPEAKLVLAQKEFKTELFSKLNIKTAS